MNDVLLIHEEAGLFELTINRPEALNAINSHVMEALHDFFDAKKGDYSVRGVILQGAGEKAFVAGADIKGIALVDAPGGTSLSAYGQKTFHLIEHFHAPVIAVIKGFCLGGGCELAMACHMRIAEPKAKFGQPEINLGIIPGYGGTQRMPQLIGKPKAIELLLTADTISAEQAQEMGLVNHLVGEGEGYNLALAILQKIKEKSPIAVDKILKAVYANAEQERQAYELEATFFGHCIDTHDGKEGVQAFIEKRKANFIGK
jgi:enoyl-CoA hydratase